MLSIVTFNPHPRIERMASANSQLCHVSDDALLEPERLLEWTVAQTPRFERSISTRIPATI